MLKFLELFRGERMLGMRWTNNEIVYEIVDAKTGNPIEGITYKLTSGSGTLLDAQTLENGTAKPYSINEHPDVSFIAWIKGGNK